MNSRTSASQRLKVYLAAPLFSDAERAFNLRIRELLRPYFDVYLPQEDGGLVADMLREGLEPAEATRRIFGWDVTAIHQADLLLILLDGRAIDEGAAFELGYACALGKLCYGLQTDLRRLLPIGNNPMIDGALVHVFHSVDELILWSRRSALIGVRD